MTVKHKCSKKVWRHTSWYLCSRPATVQRDGKWYCWQHDPKRVEAEAKKRRAAWEAKMDREDAKYKRIARNAKLGALVTGKMATMLDQMAMLLHNSDWCEYAKSEIKDARALAARIREALETNDD